MKKILLYLIGITFAMVGCTNDETINTTPTDGEINLSAGVATRVASNDDCAWGENDEVGIYTNQTDEYNFLFKISDTGTGALENYSTTPLYTLPSGSRTYYAYHPYDSALGEETTTIEIDCTEEQTDFILWATAVSNNTDVALQFAHKYTKVQFSLTAGGVDVTSLEGAKAWLTGANSTGTFDVRTGEFTITATDKIELTIDSNDTITAYLPPVESVSGNVKLWINAQDNTYLKTLTDEKWESGSSYDYDITVGAVPTPGDYSSIATVNMLLGTAETELRISNCYMVDPTEESTYIIPVGSRINTYWSDSEYGNDSDLQIGSDWTSNDTYTITPLWNDFDLASYNEQIAFSKVAGTDDSYAMQIDFAENFNYEGNMVVAVKKGGTIVWSWHIWITDYNPYTKTNGTTYDISGYGTWMDRNVGARDTYYHSDSKGSIFYQWGRKDPITSNVGTKDSDLTRTIADVVKAPEYFYKGSSSSPYDWCGSSTSYDQDRDHHWRDAKLASIQNSEYDSTKSIYDPSPLGFMVPGSISVSGYRSPFEFINSGWSFSGYSVVGTSGIAFPATGFRDITSGELQNVGSEAYYWSASPSTTTHSYTYDFTSTSVSPLQSSRRAFGCPVRSIQE